MKKKKVDKIELELRVLELEDQMKMEDMCFQYLFYFFLLYICI